MGQSQGKRPLQCLPQNDSCLGEIILRGGYWDDPLPNFPLTGLSGAVRFCVSGLVSLLVFAVYPLPCISCTSTYLCCTSFCCASVALQLLHVNMSLLCLLLLRTYLSVLPIHQPIRRDVYRPVVVASVFMVSHIAYCCCCFL